MNSWCSKHFPANNSQRSFLGGDSWSFSVRDGRGLSQWTITYDNRFCWLKVVEVLANLETQHEVFFNMFFWVHLWKSKIARWKNPGQSSSTSFINHPTPLPLIRTQPIANPLGVFEGDASPDLLKGSRYLYELYQSFRLFLTLQSYGRSFLCNEVLYWFCFFPSKLVGRYSPKKKGMIHDSWSVLSGGPVNFGGCFIVYIGHLQKNHRPLRGAIGSGWCAETSDHGLWGGLPVAKWL